MTVRERLTRIIEREELDIPVLSDRLVKALEQWEQTMVLPRAEITLTTEPVSKSRFGGPSLGEPPLDSNGKPMRMLCALFCEEFPHVPDFPKEGILRFYIGGEELLGLDYDHPTEQKDFRVLYDPTADDLIWQDTVTESELFPISGCYYCHIEPVQSVMSMVDYRFPSPFQTLKNQFGIRKLSSHEEDAIWRLYASEGHGVGGYAWFTQDDPRGMQPELEVYDTLLLQIGSVYRDPKIQVMFGDGGVCSFHIPREKLKQRDFSDVLYWWDCY